MEGCLSIKVERDGSSHLSLLVRQVKESTPLAASTTLIINDQQVSGPWVCHHLSCLVYLSDCRSISIYSSLGKSGQRSSPHPVLLSWSEAVAITAALDRPMDQSTGMSCRAHADGSDCPDELMVAHHNAFLSPTARQSQSMQSICMPSIRF